MPTRAFNTRDCASHTPCSTQSIFGKKIIYIFQSDNQKNLNQNFIKPLLTPPAWHLRGAGAIETGLGLAPLGNSSLKVPAFYKLVAKGYAANDPGWRGFYRQLHRQFDQALYVALPHNGKILDLGCGVITNVYVDKVSAITTK